MINAIIRNTLGMICLLSIHIIGTYGQKSMDYTHYMFNNLLENPAYAGRPEISNVVFLTRHQWIGMDGAPTSYVFSLHTPLKNKNAGAGIDLMHNAMGPLQVTGLFIDYAYTLNLSKTIKLSMGLQGGGNLYEINLQRLKLKDPGDPMFQQDIEDLFLPNVGAGLHIDYKNCFFDFSVPMLLKNKLVPKDPEYKEGFSRENRRYVFSGGARIPVSEDVEFMPSLLSRWIKGAPPNIDITASAMIKGALGVGITYKMGSFISGMLNYMFPNGLRVGYAYDTSTGVFGEHLPGTHELLVGYDFEFTQQKTLSPRRF